MQTIYKYPLEITDEQIIEMPAMSQILTVQMQNGVPCIWVMVEPIEGLPDRKAVIEIFGTGHPISKGNREYIGTFQTEVLVFHVFQRNS